MKPYYERDGITIYNGDWRETDALRADVLLTDPPYGIASVWHGGRGHGWARAKAQTAARNTWDVAPTPVEIARLLTLAPVAIVWGGNYFALPPRRCWLVWNKPERNFTLAEAELAWTSADAVVRVFDFRRSDPGREHPTQKPVELMQWCLLQSWVPRGVILDPFMGSGTTLVAAKNLGRRAIGIEIEERYCELAARRLDQEVLDMGAA